MIFCQVYTQGIDKERHFFLSLSFDVDVDRVSGQVVDFEFVQLIRHNRHERIAGVKSYFRRVFQYDLDRRDIEPKGFSKKIPPSAGYIYGQSSGEWLHDHYTVPVKLELYGVADPCVVIFVQGIKKPKGSRPND